ncbi:hypothetical protein [Pseudomonas sp. RIT-To-2]|uniref:hypothetical protein n=1 Tax=Pseudomonas sp. RIT-To-2 TaxID=3462541 RepID=UPI002412FBD3
MKRMVILFGALLFTATAAHADGKNKVSKEEGCASQGDFVAKVVASRQAGVAANTVLDMTVTSETKAYGAPPNEVRSAWYRKTILAIYENPKYLYSDPSASGMSYQDACLANPAKMLIGG